VPAAYDDIPLCRLETATATVLARMGPAAVARWNAAALPVSSAAGDVRGGGGASTAADADLRPLRTRRRPADGASLRGHRRFRTAGAASADRGQLDGEVVPQRGGDSGFAAVGRRCAGRAGARGVLSQGDADDRR